MNFISANLQIYNFENTCSVRRFAIPPSTGNRVVYVVSSLDLRSHGFFFFRNEKEEEKRREGREIKRENEAINNDAKYLGASVVTLAQLLLATVNASAGVANSAKTISFFRSHSLYSLTHLLVGPRMQRNVFPNEER